MDGGMTIILIAAIGAGYFLYQKFRSGNRGGYMTEGRTRVTEMLGQGLNRQNQGANRPLVPARRDSITETGPMVYFANDRHGSNDKEYRFNYKKVGNGWRAYILRMPSLGGRSDESGTIHRLHDSGGYYICWDRPVNTLKDMQTISRRWADSIQEYISTGRFG